MTRTQRRVYDAIRALTGADGVPPTYAALAAHLGLKSRASVARIIAILCADGHVTRKKHRAGTLAAAAPRRAESAARILAALEHAHRVLTVHGLVHAVIDRGPPEQTLGAALAGAMLDARALTQEPNAP